MQTGTTTVENSLVILQEAKHELPCLRVSRSVVPDSATPGLWPTRLLCPRDSPGKKTGVGSHSLLQGTFLTQGSKPSLLHCRQMLYHLSHQGNHGITICSSNSAPIIYHGQLKQAPRQTQGPVLTATGRWKQVNGPSAEDGDTDHRIFAVTAGQSLSCV